MSRRNRDIKDAIRRATEWAATARPEEIAAEHARRAEKLRHLSGEPWVDAHRVIDAITGMCIVRWHCTPATLRPRGLARWTTTDAAGITHDWRARELTAHAYFARTPRPDRKPRPINCVECVARFP